MHLMVKKKRTHAATGESYDHTIKPETHEYSLTCIFYINVATSAYYLPPAELLTASLEYLSYLLVLVIKFLTLKILIILQQFLRKS